MSPFRVIQNPPPSLRRRVRGVCLGAKRDAARSVLCQEPTDMDTPNPDGEARQISACPAMVVVRNAYKSYSSKNQTLAGLNMTVPQGAIYAFLGPSGCGKTTLLGCMVGRRQLDSGEITLGVKYKHQVGYMPQEIALIRDISIIETLYFYIHLFRLTKDQVEKRKEELFSCLEIPSESRIIGTLSGGEQRRVSLCVTLLHDPELVILDEPTVGQDPLLCHRIWQYLHQLTTIEKKTVILTTHYIQEANQAHWVGMMRGGVLLVEGCPKAIMAEHQSESLDDVFLHLTKEQESTTTTGETSKTDYNLKSTTATKSTLQNKDVFSFTHVKAHIIKNFYWIFRTKGGVAFLLLFPMIIASVYCLAIGKYPSNLKMGLVNEELVMTEVEDCKLDFNCSNPLLVSCLFMNHLKKKSINLIEFEDIVTAEKSASNGKTWGYLRMGRNYTSSLFERLESNLNTPSDIIDSSDVTVTLDMSNMQIAHLLKRAVYYAHRDYLEELFIKCDWPVKSSRILPIEFEPMYGALYSDFTSFAIPSILPLLLFFLPYVLTVGSIIMEKKDGVLERNFISGLTMAESLLGHSIFTMAFFVVQAMFMLIVFFGVFDNILKGSILLLFILCMFVGFCGLCYGFLVSTTCNTDSETSFIGMGTFHILVYLSGIIWPFEAMNFYLKTICYFLPLTQTAESIRSIVLRDFGLFHPKVYLSFLILISWAFIFVISTFILVKLKTVYKRMKN